MRAGFIPLLICLMGLTGHLAWATTGNDLLDICQIAATDAPNGNLEVAKAMQCQGFVEAIVRVGRRLSENRFCAPDGVTVGQAIRVLVKYLHENPEQTHQGSDRLAIAAFERAWPCN